MFGKRYAGSTLSLAGLSDNDRAIAQRALQAAEGTEIVACLADIRRYVEGSANRAQTKMEEVYNETLTLQRVVDVNGRHLADPLSITMNQILPHNFYDGKYPDPHDKYEAEYISGDLSEHNFYHSALVLLTPKHEIVQRMKEEAKEPLQGKPDTATRVPPSTMPQKRSAGDIDAIDLTTD